MEGGRSRLETRLHKGESIEFLDYVDAGAVDTLADRVDGILDAQSHALDDAVGSAVTRLPAPLAAITRRVLGSA